MVTVKKFILYIPLAVIEAAVIAWGVLILSCGNVIAELCMFLALYVWLFYDNAHSGEEEYLNV